tara:strand:- start:9393 stop:9938 length:546 start_codon:yes stop_codon:yes gene_type:complete
MQLIISVSSPIKGFVSTMEMLKRQNPDTRVSLMRLSARFADTFLGKKLKKLAAQDRLLDKNTMLMDLNWGIDLGANSVSVNTLVEQKHIEIVQKVGDLNKPLGRLVVVHVNRSRSLKLMASDVDNRLLAIVRPTNLRYRPELVSVEVYGMFLLNLFRDIALSHDLHSSTPKRFVELSERRK